MFYLCVNYTLSQLPLLFSSSTDLINSMTVKNHRGSCAFNQERNHEINFVVKSMRIIVRKFKIPRGFKNFKNCKNFVIFKFSWMPPSSIKRILYSSPAEKEWSLARSRVMQQQRRYPETELVCLPERIALFPRPLSGTAP